MKSPMQTKTSIPGTLLRIVGVVVVAALLIGAAMQLRPSGSAQALPAPKSCTAIASGDWNDSANWDCAGVPGEVPGEGDAVVVDGQNIAVSANQSVKDVTVAPTGSLTVADGVTLTVGGTLHVSDQSNLLTIFANEGDTDPTMGGTIAFGPDGDQSLVTDGAWLNVWNLSKSGSGKLTVNSCTADLSECGGGLEVFNSLTLKGIQVRSAFEGVPWGFVAQKAADIDNVDVKDTTNQGALISVASGTNSGNNAGWRFAGLSSSMSTSTDAQNVALTMVLPEGATDSEVLFKDGLVELTCQDGNPVAVVDGAATCNTAELSVGSHTITASYGNGQSAQIVQVVNRSTGLSLHVNTPESVDGKEVSFLANVMPYNAAGKVTFKDGDSPICTAVDLSDVGNALCKAVLSGVGTHLITAEFVPSQADTNSSVSAPLVQSVKNLSSVVLSSSQASVNRWAVVTFTADISSAGEAGGSADFMENGKYIAGCVGVAVVNKQAVCQTSGLSTGKHVITVLYSGDGMNFSSTSAPVAQTVNWLIFVPRVAR